MNRLRTPSLLLAGVTLLTAGCLDGKAKETSSTSGAPGVASQTSGAGGGAAVSSPTSSSSSGGGTSATGTAAAGFTPSAATQKVYVSSSTGDDANPGTELQPLKSIAAGIALLRDGQPDWLLLKRGDVWDEPLGQWLLSGASASEPMLVWSYGAGARPLLRTGSQSALRTNGGNGSPASLDFVVFSGLHFQAHTRIPNSPSYTGTRGASGIQWLRGTRSLVLDDCVFESYSDGIDIIDLDGLGQSGIVLRRCQVIDSYAISPTHSQGIYIDGVDGITIEECLFDHNGWNEAVAGAEPTIFNHNIYVQTNARNVTVRKTIVMRASSHGIQLRPGGTCTDNLFVRNAISILIGGGDTPVPGGVDATCTGNVIVEGTDIDPANPRGWGIDLENIKTARVEGNIVANVTATGNTRAIDSDPNASFANNVVWSWPGSPSFTSSGPFADPSVSVAGYAGLHGGPATFQGFADHVRAQRRDADDPAFHTDAIRAYFVKGFGP